MSYNSGSNWARNFKLALRFALGRFEITCMITPWIVHHSVQLLLQSKQICKVRKFLNVGDLYNREFYALKKKSKDYYIISHTPVVAMSGLPQNCYGLELPQRLNFWQIFVVFIHFLIYLLQFMLFISISMWK